MAQEAANAVLRDFENLIWVTLILGLLGAGVWRFFSSKPSLASGEQVSEPQPQPQQRGVPADHFTGADLFVLPMVMIKYSVALAAAAVFVFTLPEQVLEWLGLAPDVEGVPDGKSTGEGAGEIEVTASLIVLNWFLSLMLISLVMVMIQWVGRREPSEVFGLRQHRWERVLLWVIVGAAIVIPVAMLMAPISHELLEKVFGESLNEQEAVQSIRETEENPMVRYLLIVDACLVAPVVEEVVFRGYLYGVLKRFTGPIFAGFIGASLFATAHNNLPAVLPLFCFALVLTIFYERSRSLWVPIGVHSLFNIVQVFLLLSPIEGGQG